MARPIHRLSARAVASAKERGLYADGGGLFLQVARSGSRSWLFRFTLRGKTRHMGLGPTALVSLAEARAAAFECRKLCLLGKDPINERLARRSDEMLAASRALTFDECAARYIEAQSPAWRNSKHRMQWSATLSTYASPVFGSSPVQQVSTELVMRALDPIWTTKAETASRLRGRIESVLNWATARGYRQGENPARWRGHLQNLLPAPARLQKVRHHAALTYEEIGAFLADVRKRHGVAPAALEFLILTAARTSEVLGARWEEFELAKRVWIIPATRMKTRREHRVPLSSAALHVVQRMQGAGTEFVFPAATHNNPLSNMALLALLKRMGHNELTVHGFRSTFRDWVAEQTNYPREVAETALAHSISNKVEAAYRRGDLLEKRGRLMAEWAEYCAVSREPAEVLPLQRSTWTLNLGSKQST
jgi:integrase